MGTDLGAPRAAGNYMVSRIDGGTSGVTGNPYSKYSSRVIRAVPTCITAAYCAGHYHVMAQVLCDTFNVEQLRELLIFHPMTFEV